MVPADIKPLRRNKIIFLSILFPREPRARSLGVEVACRRRYIDERAADCAACNLHTCEQTRSALPCWRHIFLQSGTLFVATLTSRKLVRCHRATCTSGSLIAKRPPPPRRDSGWRNRLIRPGAEASSFRLAGSRRPAAARAFCSGAYSAPSVVIARRCRLTSAGSPHCGTRQLELGK